MKYIHDTLYEIKMNSNQKNHSLNNHYSKINQDAKVEFYTFRC